MSTAASPLPQELPALTPTLTHEQAPAWVAACQQTLGRGTAAQWTLDASALQQFDSAALAALLAVQRLVLARQATLRVHALPARLQALAQLYGVQTLLPGAVASQ